MLISLLRYCLLIALAWACSTARSAINWRTIGGAVALRFGFGALVLYLPIGRAALQGLANPGGGRDRLRHGGQCLLFGSLNDASHSTGFIVAFKVLPIIIFFSSLISVLYYLRVMPLIVQVVGGGIRRALGTSRTESLSATANIFVGLRAPLAVQPYFGCMTRSEFFAVMVGGLASIAGSVLAGTPQWASN